MLTLAQLLLQCWGNTFSLHADPNHHVSFFMCRGNAYPQCWGTTLSLHVDPNLRKSSFLPSQCAVVILNHLSARLNA